MNEALNVFNEPLIVCGTSPMTGVYRDGCCNTGANDRGTHTVCAVVTNEFLQFSKSKGNDLTMDYPPTGFKGLAEGDKWCLCVSRWIEAYQAGVAPPIILKATHIKTLEHITLEELIKFDYTPMRPTDWTELNNKLEKTFKFDNYNEVVLFSNKVMQIAIDQDHHPEINVHYNFVKVRITDYEKGAVSEKCQRFIGAVNKIT
ncbi:MAG: DUF2237 family protein [Chitinophagaceae bacterium]|nr:DUF2237 family protein [Chitinophagaceae bacterium]